MIIFQYILYSAFITIIMYLILNNILYAKMRMSERFESLLIQTKDLEITIDDELAIIDRIGRSLSQNKLIKKFYYLKFLKSNTNKKYTFDKYLGLLSVLFMFIFVLSTISVINSVGLLKAIIFAILFTLLMALVIDNLIITRKIKTRTTRIEKEMGEFFSLLSITIEAGLGLDTALTRVCKIFNGELSCEFEYFMKELNMGVLRKDAYANFIERINLPLLVEILTNIEVSEKSGAPIAHILKVQSDIIQEKRAFTAREKAMKAPVKIMFPMILFIFPVLIIFTMVPALLQLL